MANFYFDFPACIAKLIFQMAYPFYVKIGPIEASVSMSNFRLEPWVRAKGSYSSQVASILPSESVDQKMTTK